MALGPVLEWEIPYRPLMNNCWALGGAGLRYGGAHADSSRAALRPPPLDILSAGPLCSIFSRRSAETGLRSRPVGPLPKFALRSVGWNFAGISLNRRDGDRLELGSDSSYFVRLCS